MKDNEFDIAELRYYMNLSAKEKLDYLEKMNRFLEKITPSQAKEIAKKLKERGY